MQQVGTADTLSAFVLSHLCLSRPWFPTHPFLPFLPFHPFHPSHPTLVPAHRHTHSSDSAFTFLHARRLVQHGRPNRLLFLVFLGISIAASRVIECVAPLVVDEQRLELRRRNRRPSCCMRSSAPGQQAYSRRSGSPDGGCAHCCRSGQIL
jgi:hypothetical protein